MGHNSSQTFLAKLRSLFSLPEEDLLLEQPEQIQNLNKTVEEHGWYPNEDAAHFAFCKSYRFDNNKEFSDFCLKAFTEKTSSHVHIDMNASKKMLVSVNVYSDGNDGRLYIHCLKTCLVLDKEYEDHGKKQREEQ